MRDNPPQTETNRFLQVWGNRVTEATEVTLDLTKGEEGVGTPQ